MNTPQAAPAVEAITHETAMIALDNLDDYARMTIGVDASGPRNALKKYILQQERAELASPLVAPVGDAEETLKLVCDALGIGVLARDRTTILMNIENARRRSDCLWRVEHEFFMTSEPDEDDPEGEPFETCLLNWGDDPDQYAKRFGEALAATRPPVAAEQGREGVLPDDLFTHKDAWRRALNLAVERADPPTVDSDDPGYWMHEVRTFDRVYKELEALRVTQAPSNAVPVAVGVDVVQLVRWAYEDAAAMVEQEDPRTSDWMWDDRNDLANAINRRCEETIQSLATPAQSVPAGGGEPVGYASPAALRGLMAGRQDSARIVSKEEANLSDAPGYEPDVPLYLATPLQPQDAAPVEPIGKTKLQRLAILNAFMVELDSRLRMGESHRDGMVSTKMLRDLLNELFKAAPAEAQGNAVQDGKDARRLDYLQQRGATISIVQGDGSGFAFLIGGLYSSANPDIRQAIDAAILSSKAAPGGDGV